MTDAVVEFVTSLYKYPQYIDPELSLTIWKMVEWYLIKKSRLRKVVHPVLFKYYLYKLQNKTINDIIMLLPKKLREILQL